MARIWDSLSNFARWFSLALAVLAGLALLMSAINAARVSDPLGLQVGLGFLAAMVVLLAAAWIALRGGSLNYLRILWFLLATFCFVVNTFSRVAGARWVQAFLLFAVLGLATSLAAKKKAKA